MAGIQPGMPEPFIEVLRQYEQFMNADKQDLNDEDVREEIDSADGKWRYLYDELCDSPGTGHFKALGESPSQASAICSWREINKKAPFITRAHLSE